MYCHHILADYITLAAAPVGLTGQQRPDMDTTAQQHTAHLLPGAAAALKQGACALHGACLPAQVQTTEHTSCMLYLLLMMLCTGQEAVLHLTQLLNMVASVHCDPGRSLT